MYIFIENDNREIETQIRSAVSKIGLSLSKFDHSIIES